MPHNSSSTYLFAALPQCPAVIKGVIPYPSIAFVYAATSICAMVFAFVVALKYNSVRVFDHKIRTPSISNSLWITFYASIALGSLLNAIRFATPAICLVIFLVSFSLLVVVVVVVVVALVFFINVP